MAIDWRVGTTFTLQDGFDDEHRHPRVIISMTDKPRVVVVNLTDARNWADKSCVLSPSDDDQIDKESCIAYYFAKFPPMAFLRDMEHRGELRAWQRPLPGPAVRKIWNGAFKTKDLKPEFRAVLIEQGAIPSRPQDLIW